MTEIKVLNLGDAPREVREAVCLYAGECHGLPNDSYVPWDTGRDSMGYLTKDQEKKINQWALTQGVKDSERFLFWMSW